MLIRYRGITKPLQKDYSRVAKAALACLALSLGSCSVVTKQEPPSQQVHSQRSVSSGPARHQSCDIHFTTVPLFAAEALTDEQYAFIKRLAVSPPEDFDYRESFHDLIVDLLSLLKADANWSHVTPTVVTGGYNGDTHSSSYLLLPIEDSSDRQLISRVAAALGYVFHQQSVLFHCSLSDDSADSMTTMTLSELPSTNLLSNESASEIYELMLDHSGGDLGLGFTYYPDRDEFLVLCYQNGGELEAQVMERVYQSLLQEPDAAGSLQLTRTERWSKFILNEWTQHPNGHVYRAALGEDLEVIEPVRQEFLKRLSDMARNYN